MKTRKELFAKYPVRFASVYCGFDVGDGWLGLIDELCEKLEAECVRTGASYKVAQVKEKFGGLRFYIDAERGHTEHRLYSIEGDYEARSFKVCEDCGAGAVPWSEGRVTRTLCEACHAKVRAMAKALRDDLRARRKA